MYNSTALSMYRLPNSYLIRYVSYAAEAANCFGQSGSSSNSCGSSIEYAVTGRDGALCVCVLSLTKERKVCLRIVTSYFLASCQGSVVVADPTSSYQRGTRSTSKLLASFNCALKME